MDRERRAPLPVVALAEEPLDVLARSVVNGTAWVEGVIAAKPDLGAAPPADADAAVNGFLAKATPGALRLARILASTGRELPMPLISVLRERLAPETGVAELAEIMACGLLEYTGYSDDTGHQVLRFREGHAIGAVPGDHRIRGLGRARGGQQVLRGPPPAGWPGAGQGG